MSIRTKREAFFGSTSNNSSSTLASDDVQSVSGSSVSTGIISTSSYLNSRRAIPDIYSSTNGSHSVGNGSLGLESNLSNGSYMINSNLNGSSSDELIGFANLPNQIYRNALRKGFDFNIVVVGASGLGKSTFVNSLFLSEIYENSTIKRKSLIFPEKTIKPATSSFILKENGVELRLRIIDTPGFGDSVDNSNCWQPIINEIESRFDAHMRQESSLFRFPASNRGSNGSLSHESSVTSNGHGGFGNSDKRIHCCLYFIQPTGHGLRELDLEFLRRIQNKVNIVPLIAKADTLTRDECIAFKKQIQQELIAEKIKFYDFPESEIQLIGDSIEQNKNKTLSERQPFAVVGSNYLISSSGGASTRSTGNGTLRARSYPWGVVEVDNLEHNDFIALRTLLLSVHMRDLIESTDSKHYEAHRQMRLKVLLEQGNFIKDPLIQLEEEKQAFEAKMTKSQTEMEHLFEQKLKEKRNTLKDMEACNLRRIEQMQKQLQVEEEELEEKIKNFQLERQNWEFTSNGDGLSGTGQFNPNVLSGGGGVASTLPINCVDLKSLKPEKKKKGLF